MKRWKIGCLVIVAVVVCIAVIIAGVYLFGLWRMDKAERVIGNYLQKKYHREFVVTNGKYVWATGTYTFDASPKDDPEFTFPVFVGFKLSQNGIGDMYKLGQMGRQTHKLLDPFVDAISKNNVYGAMYGSSVPSDQQEEDKIEVDVRKYNLTPLQATSKYPGKIYLNTSISYSLDVTDKNKDEIFKKVFNLVEFLKKSGFGYISINIRFFPKKSKGGESIINKTYNESKPGWTQDINYGIGTKPEDIKDIKIWQDIQNYFYFWNFKKNNWEKVIDTNTITDSNNKSREILK